LGAKSLSIRFRDIHAWYADRMTTKKARRQAVQAIRQIVQAARDLAEAEYVLLGEEPLAKRKPSATGRDAQIELHSERTDL